MHTVDSYSATHTPHQLPITDRKKLMSQLRSTLAIVGVLATAISLSACTATNTMGGMNRDDSSSPSSENSTPFNDSDVTFAMGMVPHHKQAVEMVDMILAKEGIDAKVIDIATRIKAAQEPEIKELTSWLEAWGSPMGSMPGMSGMGGGMMSGDDMDKLDAATGVAASKLFLEQMTTHHKGAVTMAESEVTDGENPAAISLAKDIVSSQTAEITEMADILESLG